MCIGTFSPSPEASGSTRSPHAIRPSTPVTVRYSDSTGIPAIPDNDPARSGPRGIAVCLWHVLLIDILLGKGDRRMTSFSADPRIEMRSTPSNLKGLR
jgi:hypothetical protein